MACKSKAKKAKKKAVKKTATKRKKKGEDTASRRKYDSGGRIEAYTFGETQTKRGRNWPF